MNIKLFLETILKFILGISIMGILLFVPARTFDYWNAWLLISLLSVPMCIVGIIMMIKSPELLRKRLDTKEKLKEQKVIVLFSAVMFATGFVIAGLNHRYCWTSIPNFVVFIGAAVFILGYILYAEVLRENQYLSRTIKVQENQKVIDKGLYGIIRHPMYAASILMFLSMPLILGSIISFAIFLVYPFIISRRIIAEEKLLEKELEGYIEYKKKVKYKVIPFVW